MNQSSRCSHGSGRGDEESSRKKTQNAQKGDLASFEAVTASREIVGWDDPLSDVGAWIVPAESVGLESFA